MKFGPGALELTLKGWLRRENEGERKGKSISACSDATLEVEEKKRERSSPVQFSGFVL